MQDKLSAPVPKWPFFLGDVAMLGVAWFIYYETHGPLGRWEFAASGLCVALGAGLGILPYYLDHRARVKQMDAAALGSVSEKIQKLEQLAVHISAATTRWEFLHSQAEKTANIATEITDRISNEAREFTEFMSKANDNEKATLRLETEKLRRAEGDWVQVLVLLLDHIHALHSGAARSGQPRLIEQLTHFQNACREVARRVGLVVFAPAPGEAFDPKRHQTAEGETIPANAIVNEVLSPGFTFQGRLVRRAAVRAAAVAPVSAATPGSAATENQLSLETS
jgi:molecular chaperone GrpE (heat shock protein)